MVREPKKIYNIISWTKNFKTKNKMNNFNKYN